MASPTSPHRRWVIIVKEHSAPDKYGRQLLDVTHTAPDGNGGFQTYFANKDDVVRSLRHNLASNFWFYRMRARLARQYNH